jgi:hypothetical protein
MIRSASLSHEWAFVLSRQRIFPLTSASRPVLGPIQLTVQWVWGGGVLSFCLAVISNEWVSTVSYWSVPDIHYIYMLLSEVQSFFILDILFLGSATMSFVHVSLLGICALLVIGYILCNRRVKQIFPS